MHKGTTEKTTFTMKLFKQNYHYRDFGQNLISSVGLDTLSGFPALRAL